MKIVIDAGHGGHDSGAVGVTGLLEKDVTLEVALRLAHFIEGSGDHQAQLTRNADHFVDLGERCRIANDWGADFFISIHANAPKDLNPQANGFEVWTSPGLTAADAFATRIWTELREANPEMRARLDVSDGDPDKESKFRVLIGTNMAAVLLELAFITNPGDEARLRSPVWQSQTAEVVCRAILGRGNTS